MITFSLQSGSNGNSIYVEAGEVKLLFDAGISGKQAELRLAGRGRDIRDCDGLLVSHDHIDHTRCAGVYRRKFGLPLHITAPTLGASRGLGRLGEVRHSSPGSASAPGCPGCPSPT